jgi:hypothetical protein
MPLSAKTSMSSTCRRKLLVPPGLAVENASVSHVQLQETLKGAASSTIIGLTPACALVWAMRLWRSKALSPR